jgi:hypothetical protein
MNLRRSAMLGSAVCVTCMFVATALGACAEGGGDPLIETPDSAIALDAARPKDVATDRGQVGEDTGLTEADTGVIVADTGADTARPDASRPDSAADTGVVDASADSTPDAQPDAQLDASRDSAADAAAGSCAALKINEFTTEGPAGADDEFVEVYNTSNMPVTLSAAGCRLVYRAKAGVNDVPCVGANVVVPANGYAVLGGNTYVRAKAGDLSCALQKTDGQLGIFSAADVRIDSLGYGAPTANPNLIEDMPSGVGGPAGSMVRMPDGADSDKNQLDFKTSANPTPSAANRL